MGRPGGGWALWWPGAAGDGRGAAGGGQGRPAGGAAGAARGGWGGAGRGPKRASKGTSKARKGGQKGPKNRPPNQVKSMEGYVQNRFWDPSGDSNLTQK